MQRATLRKLELIHAAKDVEDLRIPPGNRMERLVGDRRGQHSIRVNAQWRLCFVWRGRCGQCRTRRLPLRPI
ncbi:type II toxin-antitoxin system RelE/ParE family toxin [Gordonia liuliyuniae]|uniref:type II toxin-antitoxin system RelE/ParE family toxin n=1 Tax=Gordonia liuliyuniae TaxID=2911517 RepID=UPI003558C891